MTDTETSSFESPLKVDKDWREKFFYPANHVESVNQIEKQVRKNNDAPIIEDWVSDDEDEVESHEKKTDIPTTAKTEKPVRKQVRYAEMYRSQRPRGNQRNWKGQKSNQLGCEDIAKILRKRLKPGKHEHGNRRARKEPGESYQ
ncbi:hypothetical protein Tco_1574541, partial [Tanacetum coccineum]